MKHVLIPTDFSENAWNAVLYSLSLFKKTRCTFYLFHVNPLVTYSGAETSVRASREKIAAHLLKESEVLLQELLTKIEALPLNSKHLFVTLASYDFFVDAIRKQVDEKKIDLIVMGTKGASGLKKITLGSNTSDVITKVKCPLLAIPENAAYRRPREMAFPTDYLTGYDLRVLETLTEMAILNKAHIRILHISQRDEQLTDVQEKNKAFLEDYFRDVSHSFHFLTGSKLEAAVQCFCESRDIDMIAMVAKNLNYFQRILFRPAVQEISYHTHIPFLVLHE
ncbi:universal stress protein [Arenibacter sp. GZD96]|uniref:universal stress protein n=1 Tax=Aurantibrevibacter litoralis TaxID=3106030 RepID=UPI002AFF2BAC|nr:universal stress protein [Arenibacter sp. GZD-96]MEA1785186.1 universal stress protein [Arenibacter sp. GZD-96]